MWRPRDRERFIGGYDPEHEMPDPERDSGDRFQSSIYRHNARDTRYPYRWNPDRFEERFQDRDRGDYERDLRWNRDARDIFERGYQAGYQRGYDHGRGGSDYYYEGDFGPGGYDRDRDRDRDRWRH